MRNVQNDENSMRALLTGLLTEPELLGRLEGLLRHHLPAGWGLALVREPRREGTTRPREVDAVLTVRGPDQQETTFMVEAKTTLNPRDVLPLVAKWKASGSVPEDLLVLTSYLGPRTRALLTDARVNYADATGNLWLVHSRPAIWLEATGAQHNPLAVSRGLLSLKGAAAGRTVRALCDFRPPYSVSELATRAQVSAPTVSRIAQLLDREALLKRNRRGTVLTVQWADLLRTWTRDYGVTSSNAAMTYLDPRGLPALQRRLAQGVSWSYALTGSLAATQVAPLAPARLAMLYVSDREQAAADLELEPTERGANVLLLSPFDPVVFERTWSEAGLTFAAYSQVAADLLTSPGRGPQEGEAIMTWMEAHADVWQV